MFWGITPVLDLLQEYKTCTNPKSIPEELNVLIIGGADSRHILNTLAKRYRHKNVSTKSIRE